MGGGDCMKERKYRNNIGEIVNNLRIINQIVITRNDARKEKGCTVECLECGSIYDVLETSLIKKCGCRVCKGNRYIVKGINDVATTHPHLVKYFATVEDAYKHSHGSEKHVLTRCPECGNERTMKILNLTHFSFSCPSCSDGVSYPNKLMFNVLTQLNIDFVTEYSPEWVGTKRYDFYIPSEHLIIEMDGGWHEEDNKMSGQTKEESKTIDDWKDKQAELHGIDVVRIKADKSDLEYIKENIFKSKLTLMCNLTTVDWLKCHEFALSSRVKEACALWNSGVNRTIDIASKMKMEYSTIRDYLNRGAMIDWCDYNLDIVNEKRKSILSQTKKKKVLILETGNIFGSVVETSNNSLEILGVFIDKSSISRVCRGERLHAKGFHFKYV